MLILGDMGEVGTQGPAFHREIGQYAQARGIDYFWTMGDLSRHADGQHFEAAPSLMEALTTELVTKRTPVSSLLVKGSRFMRMERVVEHIEGLAHGA
jgi:UDP-N-acetylmuramoyl-tripeptide--D-alanyl-D-alanine ligase